MTLNMLNLGNSIKVSSNRQTHSCKIVQVRHCKIEVEYVNCPKKTAFLLDDSDQNIVTRFLRCDPRVGQSLSA